MSVSIVPVDSHSGSQYIYIYIFGIANLPSLASGDRCDACKNEYDIYVFLNKLNKDSNEM